MCYIDLYFLLNWWMDVQILNIADTILRRHRKRKIRYLLASVSALLTCIQLWSGNFFIGVINFFLWILIYRKDAMIALVSCMLLGGGIYAIGKYASIWIFIGLPKIILWIIKGIQKRQQLNQVMAEVSIWISGKKIQVKALIDTGNQLYTKGKPVHIMEGACLDLKLNPEEYLYIPFQSVGKENGIIPAIKVDRMLVVTQSNEISFFHSIIGLSKAKLSQNGEYQMLLHSSVERGLYVHWRKCS